MLEQLKNLDPKQKRIAMAIGGGALLAVFVLITKRGGSDASAGAATGEDVPTDDNAQKDATSLTPDPSTFADNGSALGQLDTTLTGISSQLQTLADNQASQAAADAAVQPAVASAPAQAGTVSSTKRKSTKKHKAKSHKAKTTTHHHTTSKHRPTNHSVASRTSKAKAHAKASHPKKKRGVGNAITHKAKAGSHGGSHAKKTSGVKRKTTVHKTKRHYH
jgi:hypothetical protein